MTLVCVCLCSRFYQYSVSNDGVEEKHGDDYEKDYFTDVIKREAVQFIKDSTQEKKPFFVYIGTPAPHRPATPAPQYNHTFDNHPAPRTPSYNYNSTDKHWIISEGWINNQSCKIVEDNILTINI